MADIRGTERDRHLSQPLLETWHELAYHRALGILGRSDLADRVVEACWSNLMLKIALGIAPNSPSAYLLQSVLLGSLQIRRGPHPKVRLAGDWSGDEFVRAAPVPAASPAARDGIPLDVWRSELSRLACRILPLLTPRQTRVWCACRLARTMKRAATLAGTTPRDLRTSIREIARKARAQMRSWSSKPTRSDRAC